MDQNPYTAEGADGDFLISLLSSLPIFSSYSRARLRQYSQYLSIILSTFLLFLLVTTCDAASLLERPAQSCSLVLFGSGAVIATLHSAVKSRTGSKRPSIEQIPLSISENAEPAEVVGVDFDGRRGSAWFPYATRFSVVSLAIVSRVYMLESVLRNMQCATPGVEASLPLIILVWESKRKYRASRQSTDSQSITRLPNYLLSVIGAVIVSWASILASRISSYPRSTVICPTTLETGKWILLLQCCGVCLDAWLLTSAKELLATTRGHRISVPPKAPFIIGILFIVSALCVGISAGLISTVPPHRSVFKAFDAAYAKSLAWAVLVFTLMVLCSLRLLLCEWQPADSTKPSRDNTLDIAIVVTFLVSSVNTRTGSKNIESALSPNLYLPAFPPFLLLFFGCNLYYFTSRSSSKVIGAAQGRSVRLILYFLFFLTFCVFLSRELWGSQATGYFHAHPIDRLIHEASKTHKEWSRQASSSATLAEAVKEYVRRYGRHPPPGFDKWFSFAQKRDAHVLDDFDTIEENLRPFWRFRPDHIRLRTKLLLLDTSNECAEVSIRNGKATVGRVIPTHRWMVEGIINMLDNFVAELPDMDIAFNINDEPRVAVPYSILQSIMQRVPDPENVGDLDSKWSSSRASSWDFPESTASPPISMELWSFRQTFREFGSAACPPDSPARMHHLWDSSTLCNACFKDHSVGPFMSDWRRAESPCHQPDLANMHGFYLSPSAFKATREMIPIFSQSRTGGYADILYPSAWNYNDKIKYDPSDEFPDEEFPRKKNMLFWRGTATEGYSNAGTWKGQVRQRMVHLANNSTAKAPVLLPISKDGYSYKLLTSHEVPNDPSLRSSNFSASLFFVDIWPRCADGDCEAQDAEFGLAPTTNFQYHWQHRFLMDADGAAFSGRFLPFLQSHSVPVKTAIFREWYDSRIVAWKHFVPVDVRMHGLWSTIAYFAGEFGVKSEVLNGVDPAESIAEDGREWASKVLRKEDMEIYFYRLLLEYGRITDDRRDQLGFT